MTFFAVFLLIISSLIHAVWNVASKKQKPTAFYFLIANTAGVMILSPAVLWWSDVSEVYVPVVWVMLALTGFFQAVYFFGLAGAYRGGDLSVAYPVLRSLPIVLVAFISLASGKVAEFNPLMTAGIILIVAGSFMLPLQNFRSFSTKYYRTKAGLMILFAACGTAGYMTVDDLAIKMMTGEAGSEISRVHIIAVYEFFEAVSASLMLWAGIMFFDRKSTAGGMSMLKSAAFSGIAIYAAYILVLEVMTLPVNVTFVTAFRQAGIFFASILSILVLKEKWTVPKVAGIAGIFIGLILLSLE